VSQHGRVVHVVGTGTIGEPLIALLCDFKEKLGFDDVTFHKRTPRIEDRAKVRNMVRRGARLACEVKAKKGFEEMGITPAYETHEALERASVVIDCTPSGVGIDNKQNYYEGYKNKVLGFIAQGSEFGFGKMYARGINDKALQPGKDQFIHVVSCNTHNLAVLIQTISLWGSNNDQEEARFLCIRRANDISQDGKFVPAPTVGNHDDEKFGTHHARDAYHLFKTLNLDLNVFSSAMKVNSQYMHAIWFSIRLNRDITLAEVKARFHENPRVAVTEKHSANTVFSFGRDYGHYGRILSQTVVVQPTLHVRGGREVVGFCFTPQDGNSILSSVSAAAWFLDPVGYEKRIECLNPYLFDEV